MYPTAAKLIAGLLFAGLAWGVSELVKPWLPPGRGVGWLSGGNALLGLGLGWRILGPRAARDRGGAIAAALTTAVALVVASAFVWALAETIHRSMEGRYRGPVQALEQGIDLMVTYLQYPLVAEPLLVLLGGAIFIGLVTAPVARWFR